MEREFFMTEMSKTSHEMCSLQKKIDHLQRELDTEKTYNFSLFADQQVSQMC